MTDAVTSIGGVSIRLPEERWAHIVGHHDNLNDMRAEVLETVGQPERIVAGSRGELLAVRRREPGKWLVVAYREFIEDGFIITAFLTSKVAPIEKRRQIWP